MVKRAVLGMCGIVLTPFVVLFAPLFYMVARTGVGINICRRLSFQPMLVHFYQPVPEYESVPDDYFKTKQEFPGFEIDPNVAKSTLASLAAYAEECDWPESGSKPGAYQTDNTSFGYSSACLLHSMIRWSGAKRVVEIGSGFSSLVTLGALKKNHPDGDFHFRCVEPYPAAWLCKAVNDHPGAVELIEKKAEEVDPAAYLDLEPNDILFIDSTHVAKLASDVGFLYMQVLPRLPKGVIVHIHDIYIPYEYPRENFHGRSKYFWNEQYVLQAFLTNNPAFEVILPGYYAQVDMQSDFRAAFPKYIPQVHRPTSSFWLRKVG